jgi:hypothetical protein
VTGISKIGISNGFPSARLRLGCRIMGSMRMSRLRFAFAASLLLLQHTEPLFAASGSARSKSSVAKSAALGGGYGSALAVADRLLEAWRIGDVEIGMSLLSVRAKETIPETQIEAFFSTPAASAYEITRGKQSHRGGYEFPVALIASPGGNGHLRRRFSTIVVLKTGNNEWTVDKLP